MLGVSSFQSTIIGAAVGAAFSIGGSYLAVRWQSRRNEEVSLRVYGLQRQAEALAQLVSQIVPIEGAVEQLLSIAAQADDQARRRSGYVDPDPVGSQWGAVKSSIDGLEQSWRANFSSYVQDQQTVALVSLVIDHRDTIQSGAPSSKNWSPSIRPLGRLITALRGARERAQVVLRDPHRPRE
jgi:hypothetical protein